MRVVHDGTTFSFVNNQSALAAPYDADTKFRRAQPGDPFSPGDPYRPECYELPWSSSTSRSSRRSRMAPLRAVGRCTSLHTRRIGALA